MNDLSCDRCVLQHFVPCGNPAHFDQFRVAVRFYLGKDIGDPYAGYIGDPGVRLWASFHESALRTSIIVEGGRFASEREFEAELVEAN